MAQQPMSGAAAGCPLMLLPTDSVLDLVSDLHAFELQLAVLRRRARQLAADRALIQQQLTKQHPQPSLSAAVAGGEQLGGQSGAKSSKGVCLQQQQQQPTALKQSQQQLPAVVNTSSSRALKRTAAGSAAAASDREAKRQQQQQGAGGVVAAGEAAASTAGRAAASGPGARTPTEAAATTAAGTRRDTHAKRPLQPADNTAAAAATTPQPAAAAPAAKKSRVAEARPVPAVHGSPTPQPAAAGEKPVSKQPQPPPRQLQASQQSNDAVHAAGAAAAGPATPAAATEQQAALITASKHQQQQQVPAATATAAGREQQQPQTARSSSRQQQSAGKQQAPEQRHVQTQEQQQHKQVQQQPPQQPAQARQEQQRPSAEQAPQKQQQLGQDQQPKAVQQQPQRQQQQAQQQEQQRERVLDVGASTLAAANAAAASRKEATVAAHAAQRQAEPSVSSSVRHPKQQQQQAVLDAANKQQLQQQAAPNAASKQQLQQGASSSTSPKDGVRRQQQQQPGQARLQQAAQQQQQQSRELPHAPLSAPARRNADAALKAAATNLQADVRTLAAARAAAGRPLPRVPPLGQPGAQSVLLQVADGATVRALVQLLCPSLDALLALTRETVGHLAEVPYGPVEPGRPYWQSQLVSETDVPEAQLLSPSGTKVAMTLVALPLLKAACTRALAAAVKARSGGVRTFFWAVQQQLKAELQHGATAQQDSQEQAGEVLRSCVLSCAHVARCLVTIHNHLVRVSQQQQQQRQRQQAAAAAAGDGGARAVPAAAAAGRGDHALQPPQQQQHEGGLLPLALQLAAAPYAAIDAAAAALGQHKVSGLLLARRAAGQQLDTRVRGSGQGVVVVIVPAAEARPLVRGLCPALDALLALSPETAPPLQNLPFRHADETNGIRWECRLNHQPLPGLQLQSVAGIKYALGNITYASFKADVVRVLNSTAAAAAAAAPRAAAAGAAGGRGGDNAGLRGFFWGVHALLCTQVENGVTARQGSKAQASGVLNQYVRGVAGVANLLVALYNLLLAAPEGASDAGHGVAPAPAGAAVAAQPAQQQQG